MHRIGEAVVLIVDVIVTFALFGVPLIAVAFCVLWLVF